tara:strand:- start:41 stop:184 length:144 start_codon:yes stop_codon:yes gene_type:complete
MNKNKLVIALTDLEYSLNQFRSKIELELNDLEEYINYVKQLLNEVEK